MPDEPVECYSEMKPDQLRDTLAKLKDKESRLEADLAIKEHPELESEITPIVLALTQLKQCDKDLAKNVNVEQQKTLKSLDNQILYFDRRVAELHRQRSGILAASQVEKFEKLRDKWSTTLKTLVSQSSDKFDEFGVSLRQIIPSIEDFD